MGKGIFIMFHRIRDLREDADLTQAELAEYLHISQRAYSYYENVSHNIPADILIRLADYYQVSLDYLLNRSDKR